MKKLLLASALLLSACGTETAPMAQPAKAEAEAAAPAAPAAAVAAAAAARLAEEKGELVDFTYGWPAEAAAIPGLDAALEQALARDRAEALATARDDKAMRTEDIPFNGHYLSKVWTIRGDSAPLLSLAATLETFTGGAHGSLTFDSILWDREAGRAIAAADLFSDPAAAFAAMNGAYCAALDQERATRREEKLPLEGDDWMTGCPNLAEQVIVPVDSDSDRRFDAFGILIPPYEAGPWAEGAYPVEVPVTDALRALVKPDYREAF